MHCCTKLGPTPGTYSGLLTADLAQRDRRRDRLRQSPHAVTAQASGCGKTTLMNLLLGLLVPERGEILVNGRNLKTIGSHDYARLIGAVMQDDILFHGTVAENIAFYDAPVNMSRVQESAEIANVARDIDSMPMQ